MHTESLSTISPLQRILRLMRQYRKELRYVLLYALVSGLITLSLPLGIQAIIGLLAGGSISASWGVLVLFVITGAVFAGLMRVLQFSIMEHLQRRIFADAALDFALRIPRLDLEKLNKEHLPEIINRFFDTITLQKGLPKVVIDGITAMMTILLSLLVLSFYHAVFVALSFSMLVVLALMFYFTAPSGLQSSLKESKYKYKLAYWLEEVGRVAATFKLAGENRFPVLKADELTSYYLDARAKHWRVLVIQLISGLAFRVLVIGGYLILGSILVMNAELNLGQFVAAEILVLFIADAVEKLVTLHETGYDILTSAEKLGQVTDLPLDREEGIRTDDFCEGKPLKLELKNLSYRFNDGEEDVLKQINLCVQSGERVAISGYSGAGLSTLMQILSQLRLDYTGAMLINDLPAQNLHLRNLRERIGDMSSQEDIFKGTIRENISLGREHVSLQMILSTCNQTGLMDFIEQQPGGIDAELLPGGKNIPDSIITKIMVSRAIVDRPVMLALEKPLGHLTLQDRVRIASLLTDKSMPWTLICATEDPVLAALCDRIVVLKDGQLVFDGPYTQLQQTPHCEHIFRYKLQ